jgi:hypothetical protein
MAPVDPHVDAHLAHVDDVIRRGRALRAALADDPADRAAAADARLWQHDCELAINQLSGASKAHWLSRAYSDALLVRTSAGGALARADLAVIVDRILDVLDRARQSLAELPDDRSAESLALQGDVAPHRFDFVHNADLRPVLEQAYVASRRALEARRFEEALVAACGILETIITDALVHRNPGTKDEIVTWPFEARIAAAEEEGLIRNGCARLPEVARNYRQGEASAIVESDARVTSQVLRIVMRDLDPGR